MVPLYLILQLTALTLAATRVPLSAHYPEPIERQATAQVLIVQIAAAALLFPQLLRDLRRWAYCVIAVVPMLAMAALLGDEPARNIAIAAVYVIVWLTMLAIWRQILTQDRWRYLAAAVVTLWTLGGPVLGYLHAEYGGAMNWNITADPIAAGLSHLHGGSLITRTDTAILLFLGIGIAKLVQNISRPRHVIHDLSTNSK